MALTTDVRRHTLAAALFTVVMQRHGQDRCLLHNIQIIDYNVSVNKKGAIAYMNFKSY